MTKAYVVNVTTGFATVAVSLSVALSAIANTSGADTDEFVAVAEPLDLISKAPAADLSGPRLVRLYNVLAKKLGRPATSRFATRTDGAERTFALIEALYGNQAPEAAAPTSSGETAANKEDDMATKKPTKAKKAKAEKVAKAPKAPKPPKAVKAPKASREKKNGGTTAIVRESSNRGKLLRIAVENPGISLKALASRAGTSSEGSTDAPTRAKIRLRKVSEAIEGSTVAFDDGKVTFALPKGVSLDSIFGC